ncbi:hypothetical protein K1719_008846 [Acacia pycnantha]|nr:hypothetical protein K1719_008846 [Acacia pycnantha]
MFDAAAALKVLFSSMNSPSQLGWPANALAYLETLYWDFEIVDILLESLSFVKSLNMKGKHIVLVAQLAMISFDDRDGLHAAEWVGDLVQLLDEKMFYQSCQVNGVTYRMQDHALFKSSHSKLFPSKLQASKLLSMLGDSKIGLKWVNVTTFYFPVIELKWMAPFKVPVKSSRLINFNMNKPRALEPEESARLRPIFLCRTPVVRDIKIGT